jgi:hypothetical protein
MPIRATEVFTPGAYPQYTYVERRQENLETTLRNALEVQGQIVSLAGPSKSGKTVLIERVVGKDNLISISGASIKSVDDVWSRVFEWMGTPDSVSQTTTTGTTTGLDVDARGSVGIPLVAKGEVGATGHIGGSLASALQTVRARRGLTQIVAEIGNSDFVVLLDDFHYMESGLQTDVAKALKEAVRLGVKIVTAVVTHRGDDVLRANPELRGRIFSIDVKYWGRDELAAIAKTGFEALNANIDDKAIARFVVECAGSPQLMQSLCLQACFVFNLRQKHEGTFPAVMTVDDVSMLRILEQTSAMTDYRSLVDVLDDGPKTRGTERKLYDCKDGTSGDVYSVLLKSVASDPPQLSFSYDELLRRTAAVCVGESPGGSSVTGTCQQMAKLAHDTSARERIIDWDERTFDLPDPYFMFYLRWSGRIRVNS